MAFKMTRKILIVNPNTTQAMTDALKPLVQNLDFENTSFTYLTAPSGVPSINNESDAALSKTACTATLEFLLPDFDAFLICCYSAHPLVPYLRQTLASKGPETHGKLVTGIFEASVATCLQSLDADQKFGIVSTGSQWEGILGEAVAELLGSGASSKYAGTETTGLNADELHSTPEAEVQKRMKAAVGRLLDKDAKAICLGCAGMAGLDSVVRDACVERLGEDEGRRIRIVDGVVSGVLYLEGALRAGL